MSHFSQLKTNLKNRSTLQKALRQMGFVVEEATNGVEVRGFFDETIKADFKILTDTHYDIGFKLDVDGSYEIVGDWDLLPKVSGIDREAFVKKVKREYAKTSVMELAQEKGYEVELVENPETQAIEMVVTQW